MINYKNNKRSLLQPFMNPIVYRLPAKAALCSLLLLAVAASCLAAPPRASFKVDLNTSVGECYNFWSVKNFTYQDIFDQPLGKEAFRRNHPYSKYINCIRFIGGRSDGKNRWLVKVAKDGRLVTDFSGMIAYLRAIQEWGYVPMIVLDNVPLALSEPSVMHKYGNTFPPKDYDAYHQYIRMVVEAMVKAFGRETVEKWRFRVMTEPDLNPGHWAATKEEYLKLYDYAVDAVTQVIPEADIGPGNILNPVKHRKWGLDIIDHCAIGKNYRTGRTGTRLRFFSCSWYGAINEPESTLAESVKMIRERLGNFEAFRDVPVEIAEFSILHDENRKRYFNGEGTEWSASWLASVAAMAWDLNIARIHQWATTSAIDTAPDAPGFEAVRAMMSEGMPGPYTHVLSMLEAMAGGQRLRVEKSSADTPGSSGGAVACRKNEELFIMLYNHEPGRDNGAPVLTSLEIGPAADGRKGGWEVSEWLIDAEHSGFLRALHNDCLTAGLKVISDQAPVYAANISETFGLEGVRIWRENLAKYEALSKLSVVRLDEPLPQGQEGRVLKFTVLMPTHSVRFLRLKWKPMQDGS